MKALLQIIAIIVVVLTVCICTVKPDMHKSVIIYNSDYVIKPQEVVTTEKAEIPIMEIPATPKETTHKLEKKIENPSTTTKVDTVKKVQKSTPVKKQETYVKPTTTQKTDVSKSVATVPKQTTTASVQQTSASKVKEVKQEVQQPVAQKQEVLTQKEEEIAWNIWRSNLQNKIMHDVYMPPIPEGTVFKFTFNVDKYGRVSNVQTYAVPSSYTPYAIQYIAPVIRSYQGKDILNFPKGSSRVTTTFTGGWKISTSERYSTPQDYNDIEKVVK